MCYRKCGSKMIKAVFLSVPRTKWIYCRDVRSLVQITWSSCVSACIICSHQWPEFKIGSPYRLVVFIKLEVIATELHTEYNGSHTLKTVDPLLPFWTLAAHVHHFERELLEGEFVLNNASGHVTWAQNVLNSWDELGRWNAVQVV